MASIIYTRNGMAFLDKDGSVKKGDVVGGHDDIPRLVVCVCPVTDDELKEVMDMEAPIYVLRTIWHKEVIPYVPTAR